MSLFRKLLLAKFIEDVELLGERLAILITDGSKLDLDDDLSVWGHHGNTSEKNLQVLWKLLSTSITWVHGNEIGAGWDEHDWLLSVWEHESLESLLLGHGDGLDLGSDDGKSWERNSVEFIEATPKSRLGNTLEDLSHIFVLVLIRAVCDDDINTEGTSEILDCLCFTCSGWTSWSTTVVHTKSLGKGNVALICETCDTKSFFGTKELVSIGEDNISNANVALTGVGIPVDSSVLLPLEVVLVLDLVGFAQFLDFKEDISLMDMNCNECLSLLSDQFVHVFEAHVGKLFHDSDNFSLFLLELLKLFFLTLLKAFLDFVSPKSLDTKKGNLRWISSDEVFKTH
jgi:hypothetical protein